METAYTHCGKKFVPPPTASRPAVRVKLPGGQSAGLPPVAHNAKKKNEQVNEVQVKVQGADDGGLLGL